MSSTTIIEQFSRLNRVMLQNAEDALRIGRRNMESLMARRPMAPEDPYRGVTAVDEVFRFDRMRVFRYRGEAPLQQGNPLLLVPSLINRAYIMDLMKNSSLAAHLREAGIPVYLLDWGLPGPQHDHLDLGFYIDDLMTMARRAVSQDRGGDEVELLGYCMGGTMSLLHCALHPGAVPRLTLLAAPIDFHNDGVLSLWARAEVFDVDRLVATLHHMDPVMLQTSFLMLKPLSTFQKFKALYENSLDPKMTDSHIHLERWLSDNVAVPGAAYREYVKLCYHDNALIEGTATLKGHKIDLRQVTTPILNIMARKDHIVPLPSAQIVSTLVGGPVQEVVIDAGHIGIAMGRKAREMFAAVAGFHAEKPAGSS